MKTEISSQQSVVSGQQRQIDEQKETIKRQQAATDELKQIVCSLKPDARICSPK